MADKTNHIMFSCPTLPIRENFFFSHFSRKIFKTKIKRSLLKIPCHPTHLNLWKRSTYSQLAAAGQFLLSILQKNILLTMSRELMGIYYDSSHQGIRVHSSDQLVSYLRRRLFEEPGLFPLLNPRGETHVDFLRTLVTEAIAETDPSLAIHMTKSLGIVLGEIHAKPIIDSRDQRALSNIAMLIPPLADPHINRLTPDMAGMVKDIALRLVQPDVVNPPTTDPQWITVKTGKLLLYSLSRLQQPEGEDYQLYLDLWTQLWDNPTRSDLWTYAFVGFSRLNWDIALGRLLELGQRTQRKNVDKSWTPRTAMYAFLEPVRGDKFLQLEDWFAERATEARDSNDDQTANNCLALTGMFKGERLEPVTMMIIRHRVEDILAGRDDLAIPSVSWASTPEEIAVHNHRISMAVRREVAELYSKA